ncbi:MAG TPA: dUTPase [Ktedonobacterales bacterium]
MADDDLGTQHAGDMLADIFTRQAELGAFYRQMRPDNGFYGLPPLEKCTTWTRAIIHECCELDDELGWKPWKNAPDREANREARLMETADILHFLVELALGQGFSAEELYAAYVRKNAENRRRQLADPRYLASAALATATDGRESTAQANDSGADGPKGEGSQ